MEGESSSRNSSGDGDEAMLESSSADNHHRSPFDQISGRHNHDDFQSQRHHHISTRIRKTIPYLSAIAFSCLLFYHASSLNFDYYIPILYHPFSLEQYENTSTNFFTTQASQNYSVSAGNLSTLLANVPPPPSPNNNSPTGENPGINITPPSMQDQANVPPSPSPTSEETEEAKLEKVLNKAAMEDKTVIVTTVNAAWTKPGSLFDIFLDSFKIGIGTQKLLNHLVVIALDPISYNRCSESLPHCYALKTQGIDFSVQEAFFMKPDYVRLVWRKIEVVYDILQLGYNILFTDTDIVWFRDPFLHFLQDADIQISSDGNNISNTGFYYVKSNNRTVQFYEFWLNARSRYTYGIKHDQQVFEILRVDPFVLGEIGIKIRLLDTAFYGGKCEPSKDLNLVCTMHANCCVGLRSKLKLLRKLLKEWKKYMALLNKAKRTKTQYTWPFPVNYRQLYERMPKPKNVPELAHRVPSHFRNLNEMNYKNHESEMTSTFHAAEAYHDMIGKTANRDLSLQRTQCWVLPSESESQIFVNADPTQEYQPPMVRQCAPPREGVRRGGRQPRRRYTQDQHQTQLDFGDQFLTFGMPDQGQLSQEAFQFQSHLFLGSGFDVAVEQRCFEDQARHQTQQYRVGAQSLRDNKHVRKKGPCHNLPFTLLALAKEPRNIKVPAKLASCGLGENNPDGQMGKGKKRK
ncbi:OLC1v1036288C1 [Oldenlandia corymbosa var. corymbosa]|uniref:OLC1v1036288C1 n=1 Tax=Oldenlandia corymbosa var. corymbosa TaxID=529605 RepID=A0AAV1CV14_OLDCO|nr:OLC1v1036288C1 [Oldenlandia corymbosa var. corymbosa]